jgi:hypothetical protein
MSDDLAGTCEECGASVYRQHVTSGIARYEGGKLMCSVCVSEYERSHDAAESGVTEEFAPIELDSNGDDDVHVDLSSSRIRSATASTLGQSKGWDDEKYGRQLDPRAISSTRCRTFHSKLSGPALEFMNNQLNDWVDTQGNITIKFATSTIGIFEGKHAEPHLILTVFY